MTAIEVQFIEPKQCLRCERYADRLIRSYCESCYATVKQRGEIASLDRADVPITSLQREFITGCLLGDGWLTKIKGNGTPAFGVDRSQKDLGYLEWQYEFISNLCLVPIALRERFNKDTQRTQQSCGFHTRHLPSLLDLRKLWYPEGKKVIPANLKLTRLITQIWYCDDGCIKVFDNKRFNIILATQGFTKDEVAFLIELLVDKYDEDFVMLRQSSKKGDAYGIRANRDAAATLLTDLQINAPPGIDRKFPSDVLDVLNRVVLVPRRERRTTIYTHRTDWTGLCILLGADIIYEAAYGALSFEQFLSKLDKPEVLPIKSRLIERGEKKFKRAIRRFISEGKRACFEHMGH